MESLLTEGGVQQLIEAEGLFTNRHHPKLQVINIRRVPANALTDVYWVRCSESIFVFWVITLFLISIMALLTHVFLQI